MNDDDCRNNALNQQLLRAASTGDIRAAKEAVAGGADIAARQAEGLTPLHIAVGLNDLPLARYLVEEAGAPFVTDGFNRMPTVVAVQCRVSEDMSDYVYRKELEDWVRTEPNSEAAREMLSELRRRQPKP